MIDDKTLGELRALSRPDEPLIAEMVRVYFERTSVLMKRMTDALAARDLVRLHETAHAFAGCSTKVGALELSHASRALERAEADWHELASRIRVLDWERREVELALLALPEVAQAA
ncbi:MAG TPA: Hpt domain-containing protein [Thermoanaerobaculia bacterium]